MVWDSVLTARKPAPFIFRRLVGQYTPMKAGIAKWTFSQDVKEIVL